MFSRLSLFRSKTTFSNLRHFGTHYQPKLVTKPYDVLVRSIPIEEKQTILAELDSNLVIQRANLLCEELARNDRIGTNQEESRTVFLAALRNLKENKITINQLATLHILDSAIRTLYTDPISYFIYRYVNDDKKLTRTLYLFSLMSLKGMPTSVKRAFYDSTPVPAENITLSQLPWRMQKPLMQRFFNFTQSEWTQFCKEMNAASPSEQWFHILVAPEEGRWSSAVASIQKIMKCMRILDWLVATKDTGFEQENIMLVPSFTMFQAAINAKAQTLNRKPV